MADIIQLLPDSIANQIAAGEVIQRPASVVKELMENSIDAGSSSIKLIVKDAGKTLLQIIDDGCGMSETDARMSFERHATSKIRNAKDLFAIRTMGFRGEAMASIAAIAQVELKTRRQADELGVKLLIEGSEIKKQEACQCPAGTSTSVKNLFFNVPARRNFLKSDTVEMRHILDEFQRIALANTDIFFSLHHNGNEIFHLPAGKLRQRIVGIFGTTSNKHLVPVEEDTDIIKLSGYIGKPEFAKKTRGTQFFFVNNRFIKSNYLNHAIMSAYEELLQKGTYPFYAIYIDIDPKRIDINVHPTKQEIKFDDERLIYNYLKVAVRHALGTNAITPTLDFDQNVNFANGITGSKSTKQSQAYETKSSKGNASNVGRPSADATSPRDTNNLKNWKNLYEGLDQFDPETDETAPEGESLTIESKWAESGSLDDETGSFSSPQKKSYQIHASYIVSNIKSGFLLIDQQSAHERILFEQYLNAMKNKDAVSQKELFPKTITLPAADATVLKEIIPEVNKLGFEIQEFGKNDFVIHAVPANVPKVADQQAMLEKLLEQYKENIELKLDITENIARAMARSSSIKRGQKLNPIEMKELIDRLFACEVPYKSPFGRNCFITYDLEELDRQFGG